MDAGALALFLVLAGGVAYGANTVFSEDIVNGEVKAPDIGTSAVTGPKIRNADVSNVDLATDAVDASKIEEKANSVSRLGGPRELPEWQRYHRRNHRRD